VAVLCNNNLESATSLFAIPRAGLTYVTLNARHSAMEHLEILKSSETDAVIVGDELIDMLEPILPSLPDIKHLISVGRRETVRLTYDELVAD